MLLGEQRHEAVSSVEFSQAEPVLYSATMVGLKAAVSRLHEASRPGLKPSLDDYRKYEADMEAAAMDMSKWLDDARQMPSLVIGEHDIPGRQLFHTGRYWSIGDPVIFPAHSRHPVEFWRKLRVENYPELMPPHRHYFSAEQLLIGNTELGVISFARVYDFEWPEAEKPPMF